MNPCKLRVCWCSSALTISVSAAQSHSLRLPTCNLLPDTIRDGAGLAQQQPHNLHAADRLIPDLTIMLDNKLYLCDVTVF